jgi:hypothetical protein
MVLLWALVCLATGVIAGWLARAHRSRAASTRDASVRTAAFAYELERTRGDVHRLQSALDALPIGVVLVASTGAVIVRNANAAHVGGSVRDCRAAR